MCGRYSFPVIDHFFERYSITHPVFRLEPHYNIHPGMQMPVVLRQSPRQAALMRWGLIPFWRRVIAAYTGGRDRERRSPTGAIIQEFESRSFGAR